MNNPKLFEYALIWHPTKEEKEKGLKSKTLTCCPQQAFAESIEKVNMIAAMAIPEEYKDQIDQIEIAVRPF